jgi:hypothetical protein
VPLPSPRLDDRNFQQLLEAAYQRIRKDSPDWDDLSPGDPGVVLLDVFAYLTETMIYRLNRLPEKAYIAMLRLLGVTLQPPAAAATTLRFTRVEGSAPVVEIARGTRVTTEQATGTQASPVFVTTQDVRLEAGQNSAEVIAYHCEEVVAELVGEANGLPGLTLFVQRPPIIGRTGDPLDLVVGVEALPAEVTERAPLIEHRGTLYRIWNEAENFSNVAGDDLVYVADRMSGTIYFAPALRQRDEEGHLWATAQSLAAIPPANRQIRVWYRRGGGAQGNVMAKTLTKIKDPIRVEVTNVVAATGGREGETLQNALLRGPKELHTLERAVTANDYELVALRASNVARARAFTQADVWRHAKPGTVEVLIVPYVPEQNWSNGQLSKSLIKAHETPQALEQIQRELDERRSLGTFCIVRWAQYKVVSVQTKIVVRRTEQAAAVRERVLERLYRLINPLPSPPINAHGWAFGAALRVSHIYDALLAEPGVRWVDDLRLLVEDVPGETRHVEVDAWQPNTWYAASGAAIFRSMNNAGSWELVEGFPEQAPFRRVRSHPYVPGYMAAMTYDEENSTTMVYVSADCGESWRGVANTAFEIEDMAWGRRDNQPVLFLAGDGGFFELNAGKQGSNLVQLLVDRQDQSKRFYAVATVEDAAGQLNVIVAAQNREGVYLSTRGGRSGTFRPLIGIEERDVHVLAVQPEGGRLWLWAGTFAFGDIPGDGCFRWELRGDQDPIAGWEQFNNGWNGGSCRGLAFIGTTVYAATHRSSVAQLNAAEDKPQWRLPHVNSGLPVRDLERGRFLPVSAVAADPRTGWIMAGVLSDEPDDTRQGIYRTRYSEEPYLNWRYELVTSPEFDDRVPLPSTWLLISSKHSITVETGNETA